MKRGRACTGKNDDEMSRINNTNRTVRLDKTNARTSVDMDTVQIPVLDDGGRESETNPDQYTPEQHSGLQYRPMGDPMCITS